MEIAWVLGRSSNKTKTCILPHSNRPQAPKAAKVAKAPKVPKAAGCQSTTCRPKRPQALGARRHRPPRQEERAGAKNTPLPFSTSNQPPPAYAPLPPRHPFATIAPQRNAEEPPMVQKVVFQREQRDCGVAALAMATGRSYEEALSVLPYEGKGLRFSAMQEGYRLLTGRTLIPKRLTRWSDVPATVIVSIRSPAHRYGYHWAVKDSDGDILCPVLGKRAFDKTNYRMCHALLSRKQPITPRSTCRSPSSRGF